MEGLEVNEAPYVLFFKIIAALPCGEWCPRLVMKTFRDVQDFHSALLRELPSMAWACELPSPHSADELADLAFRLRLNDYFACIAGNREAVETHCLKRFFHFTCEHRRAEPGSKQWTRTTTPTTLMRRRLEHSHSAPVIAPSCASARRRRPEGEAAKASGAPPVPEDHPPEQAPVGRSMSEIVDSMDAAGTIQRAQTLPNNATTPKGTPRSLEVTNETNGKKKTRWKRPSCVICLERRQETALDPCGHICLCQECTAAVKDCPVCRKPIQKVLRIYIT